MTSISRTMSASGKGQQIRFRQRAQSGVALDSIGYELTALKAAA
jgi:hypothetical protein